MNYIDKKIKEISNNNTMGILICKRENKFVIEYCSDERIAVREYELVWYNTTGGIMELNKLNILGMKKIVSREATLYIDKSLIHKIFKREIDIGSRIKVIDIFLNHYITSCPEIYDFIFDNSQIVGYTMKYYPSAVPFSQNMKFEYIRKKCLELIELYLDMKKTYDLCYSDFHSKNIYINNSSILLLDVDSCVLGKDVNENITDKLLCDYVLGMIYKVMFFDCEIYFTPSERQIIRSNLYKDINGKSIETISDLEFFMREVTEKDTKKVLRRIPYNLKKWLNIVFFLHK